MLRGWKKGRQKIMPASISMLWGETQDHTTEFSFGFVNRKRFWLKSRPMLYYPSAVFLHIYDQFLVILHLRMITETESEWKEVMKMQFL